MKIILLSNPTISTFEKKVIYMIAEYSLVENIHGIIYRKKEKTVKDKIVYNLKKGRGGYILIMALKRFFSKTRQEDAKMILKNLKINYHEVTNLYSLEVLKLISDLRADLIILIGGFGIIKKQILQLPKIGVISYHHGDMSKYRGMPPGFWELYNNEKEAGITIQLLNEGLDSGIPLVFKKVDILPNDSYSQLLERMHDQSPEMIIEALSILERCDKENFTPIQKLGKIYTLPNLTQWIKFQIKITKRKLINVKTK